MPLPAMFDGFTEREVRVSPTSLVHYDRNRYSVDCRYAGKTVSLRAYADRIVVVAEGEVIAHHARRFERDKTFFDPWHYVPALARKPGALRNGAPFKDWVLPEPIQEVRAKLLARPGGDRQFVAILNAIRGDGLEAVTVACELALEAGAVSGEYGLNALNRLRPDAPAELVATPAGLALREESRADVARYDRLLRKLSLAIIVGLLALTYGYAPWLTEVFHGAACAHRPAQGAKAARHGGCV